MLKRWPRRYDVLKVPCLVTSAATRKRVGAPMKTAAPDSSRPILTASGAGPMLCRVRRWAQYVQSIGLKRSGSKPGQAAHSVHGGVSANWRSLSAASRRWRSTSAADSVACNHDETSKHGQPACNRQVSAIAISGHQTHNLARQLRVRRVLELGLQQRQPPPVCTATQHAFLERMAGNLQGIGRLRQRITPLMQRHGSDA